MNRFPLLPKPIGFNQEIYPKEPVIYKIVNVNNGKVYVGQTIQFRKRLSKHYGCLCHNKHASTYLQKSFNKHGVDAYYIEILEITTKELICEREAYWIEKLNSSNKDKGYNILINTPSPWYGKRTPEHCANISKGLTGKHPSEETRKKQSEARLGRFKGKYSPVAITILQYNKDMILIREFDSVTEASKSTEIKRSAISECLRGVNKTSGGFIWKRKEEL